MTFISALTSSRLSIDGSFLARRGKWDAFNRDFLAESVGVEEAQSADYLRTGRQRRLFVFDQKKLVWRMCSGPRWSDGFPKCSANSANWSTWDRTWLSALRLGLDRRFSGPNQPDLGGNDSLYARAKTHTPGQIPPISVCRYVNPALRVRSVHCTFKVTPA